MNRIYQGRVSKVEIPNPGNKENPWQPLPNWQSALWQHHELFQDAVNYYLVCLLSLANDPNSDMRKLREQITKEGSDSFVWSAFRKRGVTRRGLRDSVAPYLTPQNKCPTFGEVAAAVLAGNPMAATDEGKSMLAAGLKQLLSKCTGASGCRNAAPEFLPRFCKPNFGGNYVEDKASVARQADKLRFPFVLHDSTTQPNSKVLDSFSVHSIALPNPRKPEFKEAEATSKLREMIAAWRERQPDSTADWERLAKKISKLPSDTAIPGYAATSAKGEIKFRLFAMFLFSYVEKSEFTLALLRSTTPTPEAGAKPLETESTQVESAGDPVRLARDTRGYVFRAFTSLPCWGGDDSGELKWEKFDVAAFEEALKALHQVDAKGIERDEERQEKEARQQYQRSLTAKWRGGDNGGEAQRPPKLVGDPRITRLEHLVDEELKDEYEMSEGIEVKYGLHQRTIRGFREIRKKWNEALAKGDGQGRLKELLTQYKIENVETIGSPVLFDALVEEPNWIIWREPDAATLRQWRTEAKLPADANFCDDDDPLQALTDEREMLADIERLRDPIKLTPADPEHSRRQFFFSDVSDLTKKNRLCHDKNYLDAEIALQTNGQWMPREVRIHFRAPRLLRDQLKSDVERKESAWQQAMMAALGLKASLVKRVKGALHPAKFAECAAVALMPEITASGETRMLLNFPMELAELSVQEQFLALKGQKALFRTKKDPLTKADVFDSFWDAQMVANYKKRKIDTAFHLRWPSLVDEDNRTVHGWWWEKLEKICCLSIDLGQRDAAAFALLEVTPGSAPKPQNRKLGTMPNGKTWWANVRATGMLRLPGEDTKVFRNGNPEPQEELSGERGRNLVPGEWQEARDICAALGFQPNKLMGTDDQRYSFPELNDQLLYALRRAQARLARLQGWSCVAHEEFDETKRVAFEKRRKRIKEQIAEAITTRAAEELKAEKDRGQELSERNKWLNEIKPLAEKAAWDAIATRIKAEIESEREIIKRELVRIADRIQPLRGRRWEWVTRPNDTQNHILQQTECGTDEQAKLLAGQRGLSMRRIEQLESLRQRCQSLNRALRQEPGKPANLGRSKRGIELPDPCPELLDRLDALKEQRVNQTAHLILAQALGVRLKRHDTSAAQREKHNIHGEYERIPGRESVDFLVIENLKYYEMTQRRARSENARLMKWCRRQLRNKLIQLCEPYGLRVLEEWPADSSKFCSLTGVAGFRAVELNSDNAQEFRWKKHLDRLREATEGKRKLSRDEQAESELVKAIFDQLFALNKDLLTKREKARQDGHPSRPKWLTLFAPQNSGPIFIPASDFGAVQEIIVAGGKQNRLRKYKPISGICPVVGQADINAAINLGLRAMAAPETREIHVRIRSERDKNGKLLVRVDNKRETARWIKGEHQILPRNGDSLDALSTDTNPNFYVDLGNVATFDRAKVDGEELFASGRGIWGSIKGNERHTGKNWLTVNVLNNNRLEEAGLRRPLKEEDDDVPK